MYLLVWTGSQPATIVIAKPEFYIIIAYDISNLAFSNLSAVSLTTGTSPQFILYSLASRRHLRTLQVRLKGLHKLARTTAIYAPVSCAERGFVVEAQVGPQPSEAR